MKCFKSYRVIMLFLLIFLIVTVRPSFSIYSEHSDFLLSSPSALGNGLMGIMNPAMVNTIHGSELNFIFSDGRGKWLSPQRWGLFTGVPHLGFGMIHRDGLKDYRLALGFGNPNFGFGLGYGWLKGDLGPFMQNNFWMGGLLSRPNRYLSMGFSGVITTRRQNWAGLFDLSFRPFGSDFITLFGELSWESGYQFKDGDWSIGTVLQPLPGIHMTGRFFSSKIMTIGLCFSFGRGSVAAQTHFSEDQDLSHTIYRFRLGPPSHNLFDHYLKKERYYLQLSLEGQVGYQKYLLFDETKQTLKEILSTIESTRKDNRIKGIAINLSGIHVHSELSWEIREKLKEFKAAGKRIVIYIDYAGMTEYHLASVADKLIMDPKGMLQMEGYVMGRTFLHGLLEKMGIGFDEWRYYKYKSAAEVFSRDQMSDADREQRQTLLDNRYRLVRDDICSSRFFSITHFDSLINEKFLFLPQDALDEGLVDTIGRWTDLEKNLEKDEGRKVHLVDRRGLADCIYPPRIWGPKPKIGVVYALGICAMERGIKARELETILSRLADDNRIKAVVLRVDSPGGEILASDLVAEAVKKCKAKKFVVVSQGLVAASGGYYISMNADTIVGAPHTITGSIGVIGGWVWNKGFGDKVGMTFDHVKVGKHGDLGSGLRIPLLGDLYLPDRNLSQEERLRVMHFIKSHYQMFVEKVAQSRHMNPEMVEEVAQGRVWSGCDAREIGLIDVLGGLETAIAIAKEKADIPTGEEVTLVEFPRMGWFNPGLFSPKIIGMNITEEDEDPVIEYIKMINQHAGKPLPMLPPDLYRIQ